MPECPHCSKTLDLASMQLVPAARIAEETAKRQAAEAKASDAQKSLTDLQKASSFAAARLSIAGEAVPSERDTKRILALYNSDVEGQETPPSLAQWMSGDGRAAVQALRPVAAPIAAPIAAPAPAVATPAALTPSAPPATSTNTVATPATPTVNTAQLTQAYEAALLRYQRSTGEARAAAGKEMSEIETKLRAATIPA